MVRLFHVYYPIRRVVLLGCEAVIISASFLLAAILRLGADSYIALNYENGYTKIVVVTAVALLVSYYFDLYGPQYLNKHSETFFRVLMVLVFLSFFLAAAMFLYPEFAIGRDVFLFGLAILTIALLTWRALYDWLIQKPFLQERVYVIGAGERAETLVNAIRTRKDLGMEVAGWAGAIGKLPSREELADQVRGLGSHVSVERVLLALSDRRGTMPVRELLDLRLRGVKVEEANSLLEKVNGKIEVDDLHPSSLIFTEGFRLNNKSLLLARRVLSFSIALLSLLICLPIIPIVALAIKLTSPGPVFFRQERVGRSGHVFTVYKFRTMRKDAEAAGAVWAKKNDPRVTAVGRFMRKTRLDEIPQLWNVLKGDMAFVGPRPERPEFVQWLAEKIPYFNLRHLVRPGLTGWAQVRYQYGSSVEETKQKIQYDLYYIKHMSVALDLLIMFETIKTIVLRRGAQ